jgi:uncharacterized membrane protein YeaQ/YmgE (transglycosylase-associated protein family)
MPQGEFGPPFALLDRRPSLSGAAIWQSDRRLQEAGIMEWLSWIIVGAIAGWLAGLLVKGDEGLGVIGHVLLGLVGALLGGYVVSLLTNNDPMDGVFDISTLVTAVVGAVVLVLLGSMVMRGRRSGTGPV